MRHLFEEVQVDKVTDKIVYQLEKLIKEGQLAPGNKLPSERQLIDMLGVGRSSLREALNKLEVMGYVEIKKRKGIFVKSIDSTLQLDPLRRIMQEDKNSIVQLYEIRSDIEQASAHAAALERNEKDLDEIRKCLEGFESRKGLLHFTWEHDQAFHAAIARATHNFFRIHVTMSIFDFSKEFIQPIIEGFADTKENISAIVQQHASIFKAIESKHADDAREKMKEHLDWTNQKLVEHFQFLRDNS
ncbi:MAG: FadR family transcriptional regulator [Deltaproteobacteria bacterium]|nr:FadR family transcriptional regulator [Deltaproteobacteria bacterium]